MTKTVWRTKDTHPAVPGVRVMDSIEGSLNCFVAAKRFETSAQSTLSHQASGVGVLPDVQAQDGDAAAVQQGLSW